MSIQTTQGEKQITFKKRLAIILTSAIVIVAVVLGLTFGLIYGVYSDFKFEMQEDGTYVVVGYNGDAESVTIPVKYKGKAVTAIASGAFSGNTKLSSVTIPSSVTTIGDNVFSGCTSLTDIKYEGTAEAWQNAVSGTQNEEIGDIVIACSDTTTRSAPFLKHSITFVGGDGAEGAAPTIEAQIAGTLITIPANTFSKTNSVFNGWNDGSDTYSVGAIYVMPDHAVTFTAYWVEVSKENKKEHEERVVINDIVLVLSEDKTYYTVTEYNGTDPEVTVPSEYEGIAITTIGEYAFGGNATITSITLNSSVTDIVEYAFYKCSNLTTVTMSDNITKIGIEAFSGCEKLTYNVSNGFNYLGNAANPYLVFMGGTDNEITSIVPEDACRVICYYSCYYYSKLTSFTVPTSTVSIGQTAFFNCYRLVEIINKSSLNIVIGDENDDSRITEYAIAVISDASESGFEEAADGFLYYNFGDEKVMVSYSGIATELVLSDDITTIHARAFNGYESLISVTFGEKTTEIERYAFRECKGLSEITFNEKLETIGNYAFYFCENLRAVEFNGNLKTLGDFAFSECKGLSEITFNEKLETIGNYAFSYCENLRTVELNENLIALGDYAFSHCNKLSSVVLNNNLTSIESGAFSNCYGLTSITIPASITSIDNGAFSDCYNLYEVCNLSEINITFEDKNYNTNGAIAKYAKAIYNSADYESAITVEDGFITYSDDEAVTLIGYIGTETELVIPENITVISNCVFNNDGLSSLVISDNVKSIGTSALYSCETLKTVTIGKGITELDGSCFSECDSLENIYVSEENPIFVTDASNKCLIKKDTKTLVIGTVGGYIPDDGSITEIGDYAFYRRNGLEAFTIPNAIVTLGNNFIDYYSQKTSYNVYCEVNYLGNSENPYLWAMGTTNNKIENLVFHADCRYINRYAFYYLSSLKSVVIPNSVEIIGSHAFYNCKNLTDVTFGSGLKTIEGGAFDGCKGLKTINLPDSLEKIGESAFSQCDNLTDVTFGSGLKIIEEYAFYGCENILSLTLPDSLVSIGENAFCHCYRMYYIELGTDINKIGDSAFYGCVSLIKICNKSSLALFKESSANGFIARVAESIIADAEDTCISEVNGYRYYVNGGDKILIAYYGQEQEPIIDDDTTEIGNMAFFSNDNVIKVTIPDSVVTIGTNAFTNCVNLRSLTVGQSVKEIGSYAFQQCLSLVEVCNLSELEPEKYYNVCGYLGYYAKDIYSSKDYISKTRVSEDGFVLYEDGDTVSLIKYVGDKTVVDIPYGVTEIAEGAFFKLDKITDIIVPETLKAVSATAFYGCNSLSFTKLDGVLYLGSANNNYFVAVGTNIDGVIKNSFVCATAHVYYPYEVNHFEITYLPDHGEIAYLSGDLIAPSINNPIFILSESVTFVSSSNIFVSPTSLISYYIPKDEREDNNIQTDDATYSISEKCKVLCDNAFEDVTVDTIIIPESVEYIGKYSFARCVSVITIPETVKSIGEGAFIGCTNLTTIMIPESITEINASTFSDCSRLYSVTLPTGLTTIGKNAFSGCVSLISIIIPEQVLTIEQNAFNVCVKLFEVYNLSALEVVAGSEDNGKVAYYAQVIKANSSEDSLYFANSDGFILQEEGEKVILIGYAGTETELVLPENITAIYDYAFYYNNKIVSVSMPNSVTEIGEHAFYYCSKLETVSVSDNITFVGAYAFYGCSKLNYTVCDGNKYLGNQTNPYLILAGRMSKEETVTVKDGCRVISYRASSYQFSDNNIKNVTLCKEVVSGCEGAFYRCKNLKSINLDNVIYIGDNAFYNCDALTNVNLSNVIDIGERAFYNCNKLLDINFGSVKTIGNYAFSGCGTLTNVNLGNVITIGNYAFSSCYALTNVNLSNVIDIGERAFYNCDALTNVNLSNVIDIGERAFYNCNKLLDINFGSVKTIGKYAFSSCDALTNVNLSNVIDIGEGAFYNCNKLLDINLENVKNIGNYAFKGCCLIKLLNLQNVETVGDGAFNGCYDVVKVTLGENLISIGKYAFNLSHKLIEICNNSALSIIVGSSENGNIGCYAENVYSSSEGASKITFENDWIIYTDGTLVKLMGYLGKETSVTVPSKVTEISKYAFYEASELRSVLLPDGLTIINDCAFDGCDRLFSIVIPDSVISIGKYAFYGCSNLYSVTLGKNLSSISGEGNFIFMVNLGIYAFGACGKLVEIYNKSSLELTIGSNSFGNIAYYAKNIYTEIGGSKITESDGYVIYTDGEDKILLAYIGEETELTIPQGVTEIYTNAFYNNKNIVSVSVPNSVKKVGNNAFYGCSSLTYTLEEGVAYIGNSDNAFFISLGYDAVAVKYSFDVNDNLHVIPIIDGVSAINIMNKDFVVNSNCKIIVAGAFYYVRGYVMIPTGVIQIGYRAFSSSNTTVYYCGSKADFDRLYSAEANVYYYSETEEEGCWRYVGGEPRIW